ncbi:MAG: hypothetical protein ACJAVI_000800 [Candidatus Azotimanducaceae bacterium]|jgi:hypothetical protein
MHLIRQYNLLTACLLLVLVSLPISAAPRSEAFRASKEEALRRLTTEDSQAVVQYITTSGDSVHAVNVFMLVARDLYWKSKNLTLAIVLGQAGVQYGLVEAQRIANTNPSRARELRSSAKTLAYDLSSFCWPGWGEKGINISSVYLSYGQDLARLNLRLANELGMGNVTKSRAYWLIGAHYLAISQYERARRSFVEGSRFSAGSDASEAELLMRGYIYLADLLKNQENKSLRREYESVIEELKQTREGAYFSEQLETAEYIFTQLLARNPIIH